MTFSPAEAAMEGFRVTRRAPLIIPLWALAYLLVLAAVFALLLGPMLNFISGVQAMEARGGPSPDEIGALMGSYFAAMGLIMPVALVVSAVLTAAAARAVLRPQDKAFAYLRLGADELRVGVVLLALMVMFFVLTMGVSLLMGVIIGIVAGASGGDSSSVAAAAGLIPVVLWLVLLPLLAWLGVKFSLAVPITMAERRIALFDSWNLTKGRFWPLLGMALLAWVMAMVVGLLGQMVLMPIFFVTGGPAMITQIETMEATGVFDASALFSAMAPTIVVGGVLMSLIYALQLIILHTPFSRAYLQIKGQEPTPQA